MVTNVLAIDTAGQACSVCLSAAGEIFCRSEDSSKNHSRYLLGLIDQVLCGAGLTPAQLNLLVWSAGPGSFTGLRIGASVIQALAYSHHIPVLSLSSLEVFAHAAFSSCGPNQEWREILVAVDAKMNGIYWARFQVKSQGLVRIEPDQLLAADKLVIPSGRSLAGALLVGDAWKSIQDAPRTHYFESGLLAKDALALALHKEKNEWIDNPGDCLPIYINDGQLWQKRQYRSIQ